MGEAVAGTDGDGGVKRRGRKSKEEEAWAYLQGIGISDEIIAQLQTVATGGVPKTFGELEELAMLRMFDQLGEMKGTPLVSAVKAIRQAAAEERASGNDAGERRSESAAEVIASIGSLPVARRDEILKGHRDRLVAEIAQIDEVLNG